MTLAHVTQFNMSAEKGDEVAVDVVLTHLDLRGQSVELPQKEDYKEEEEEGLLFSENLKPKTKAPSPEVRASICSKMVRHVFSVRALLSCLCNSVF